MKFNKFVKTNFETTSFLIFTATLIAAIFVYAYMGYYSRYLADDYCTAGIVRTMGFWGAQKYWYLSWTGRYAFTFFVSMFELAGPGIVPFLPGVVLLCWLLITLFLVYGLSNWTLIKIRPLFGMFLSALSIFIVLYSIPDLGQDIYWQTGLATYLLPLVFGIALIGLLMMLSLKFRGLNLATRIIFLFSIWLLAWLNSGFSEVATVLQFLIIGMQLIRIMVISGTRQPHSLVWVPWAIALAGTALGMAVMILAPGNAIRQNSYPPHQNLPAALAMSLRFSGKYVVQWFIKYANIIWPAVVSAGLAGFYSGGFEFIAGRNNFRMVGWKCIAFFMIVFGVIWATFVPSSWAMSNEPPGRVLILPSSVLALLTVFVPFFVGGLAKSSIHVSSQFQGFARGIVGLAIIYGMVSGPLYNVAKVYSQRGEAIAFAEKWDKRNQSILTGIAAGNEDLDIEMIGSNLMGLEHVQTDSSNWINVCMARYYDVEQISAH